MITIGRFAGDATSGRIRALLQRELTSPGFRSAKGPDNATGWLLLVTVFSPA